MAIDSFSTALLKSRMKGVTDQIVLKSVLFKLYKAYNRVKYNCGGDGFEFYVHHQDSGDGALAIGDWNELNAESTADFLTIQGPYAMYGRALAQSKARAKRAANAKERDTNFDYLVNQVNAFTQKMKIRFTTDLFGDGTAAATDLASPIVGLKGQIAGTGTTYLSRNRTNDAWFRSSVDTETDPYGDTNLTEQFNLVRKMNSVCDTIRTFGKQSGQDTPDDVANDSDDFDVTITDLTGYHGYEECLVGRTRLEAKGKIDGRSTLQYDQRDIVWDPYCTAGYFYFLTMAYLHLDSVEPTGQLFDIYGEDDTGMIKKKSLAGQMASYCRKPAAQGRLIVTNL